MPDLAVHAPAADLHARQAASGLTRWSLADIAAAAADLCAAQAEYEAARAPHEARYAAWAQRHADARHVFLPDFEPEIAPLLALFAATEVVADVAGCPRELYPVAKWRTAARRYRTAARRLARIEWGG